MFIVTGGAGFIGSHLIRGLNALGHRDILVVDNLQRGEKFVNLLDLHIQDYLDKDDFLKRIDAGEDFSATLHKVFHQGACTVTTEWDGRYMMRNNFEFSKRLLHYCLRRGAGFVYASSAAVYGNSLACREEPCFEAPLNVYGYSKLLFDDYVRSQLPSNSSQVVGLRYFNVYGSHEHHKGPMASVVLHLRKQLLSSQTVRLFGGYGGFQAGEQRRDFVHVDDVTAVNLWFMEHPEHSGIFNVGTGKSRSFNELAHILLRYYNTGKIEYTPFPDYLKERYQNCTEADLNALRSVGYTANFKALERGAQEYLTWLDKQGPS
jgi:ADP-L-glycero-D-manno-heptose 6-epimerase